MSGTALPTMPEVSTQKRVVLSWSSGKDSAWTLHTLRQDSRYEVVALLTSFNSEAGRVAMHGVPRALVEQQAAAAGLPLIPVSLLWPCSNADYEKAMAPVFQEIRERWQADHIAFGDLFLEDVRQYREQQLAGTGLTPLFPIWGLDTGELAGQMIDSGMQAHLTCVDSRALPGAFSGQAFDRQLLDALPVGVDPCGENGEFHTFVSAAAVFDRHIPVILGEQLERDGFVFTDIKSG